MSHNMGVELGSKHCIQLYTVCRVVSETSRNVDSLYLSVVRNVDGRCKGSASIIGRDLGRLAVREEPGGFEGRKLSTEASGRYKKPPRIEFKGVAERGIHVGIQDYIEPDIQAEMQPTEVCRTFGDATDQKFLIEVSSSTAVFPFGLYVYQRPAWISTDYFDRIRTFEKVELEKARDRELKGVRVERSS
ncbi:hypothetical protein C8R42DRAFT_641652 [Lentinula raphanica]|nr:hypothetical protein C8R42DRAFT_641652 [Lentinula raphanica]